MGMDVYGKAPSSKEGEYFRNNMWWWRPLADYCCNIAPDICAPCEHWHSNDGDGLDAAGAAALADALQEALDSGRTERYALQRELDLAALPKEPCECCEATGVTTQAVADKYPAYQPRVGQPCIQCNGLGTRDPWPCHYPFSEENVREFVTFLRACGGFEIC